MVVIHTIEAMTPLRWAVTRYHGTKSKGGDCSREGRKRGRPRKTEDSSLAPKAGPERRFGAKAVETHGLTWYNTQKEAKYVPKNWIDKGHLALEFPAILDNIRELGADYIFNEPKRCNLTFGEEILSKLGHLIQRE
ncbi:hypothetical protein HAX54_004975 [Datura stramonium]|uniref:Uncharacterized protein n=1 Tax=Datura stramonium TaxID=4076 RepID=A0ABS8TA94_DATST|nr:hypothetical protein [Datura stramonium]